MNAKGVSHERLQRSFFVAGLIVLVILACTSPRAMAQDRAAHMMRFKICEPVEFPGRVLEPGTYYIRRDLPPLSQGSDVVIEVLDEHQKHVLVSTIGIPAQRLENPNGVSFIFYEAAAGTPPPVRTWYLPGNLNGYDFVYPKGHLAQVAAGLHATTVQTAEVTYSPLPHAEEAPPVVAEVPPVVEPPVVTPAPEPPAPQIAEAAPAPTKLPKTAGEMPLLVFLGGLCLLAFSVVHFARRRS
jgi:LPXTG-motif cell wall-anchored protein